MAELKKEITDTLKKLNDKIINKLSLQKEEDKKITIQDVDLLLWVARNLSLIIDTIGEQNGNKNEV